MKFGKMSETYANEQDTVVITMNADEARKLRQVVDLIDGTGPVVAFCYGMGNGLRDLGIEPATEPVYERAAVGCSINRWQNPL